MKNVTEQIDYEVECLFDALAGVVDDWHKVDVEVWDWVYADVEDGVEDRVGGFRNRQRLWDIS